MTFNNTQIFSSSSVYIEGVFRSFLARISMIFVYETTVVLDTALPSIDVDQQDHFMYKLQWL